LLHFSPFSGTIPFGGLLKLSQVVHINDSTLSHWTKLLKVDPSERPSRRANAAPRRIFTDLQDKALRQRIQTTSLDRGLHYCDEEFCHDALRFYEDIPQQFEDDARVNPEAQFRLEALPLFKASNHSFGISVAATDFPYGGHQYPPERIINIDETNWRSVSPGFWTWATTGTESVCCRIENDEKEGIAVIASVDAAGAKLRLTIIGKHKILRCLSAFNLSPEVWTATPQSGWITWDVMCRYFQLFWEHLDPPGPVLLIHDTYAAHCAAVTKAAAALQVSELLFIPQGARADSSRSIGGFSGF
jgi:hypothetical protein